MKDKQKFGLETKKEQNVVYDGPSMVI